MLILIVIDSFSCASAEFIEAKKLLNNCRIENKAKDTIINVLYRKEKESSQKLEEEKNKSNNRKTSTSITTSRLKTCRKDFLDCKVKKEYYIEYNKTLKHQIESEVCSGKRYR
jgi:hypothetical protein